MDHIQSVQQCISREEQSKRFGVTAINSFIWLILIILFMLSMGALLLIYAISWLVNWLLSEYNVKKLQALGTTATGRQFPEIAEALKAVCDKYGVTTVPKVIVINESSINAFALKFARKKVVVLLSNTLEGILHNPAELRFFLGHEVAHIVLDFGARGAFELYKPAAYKVARELTCDNCACAASGSLDAAKRALKRTGVGNLLIDRLDDESLVSEAKYIYSGLSGWLLKQHLTHPPLGKRIENVTQFFERRI